MTTSRRRRRRLGQKRGRWNRKHRTTARHERMPHRQGVRLGEGGKEAPGAAGWKLGETGHIHALGLWSPSPAAESAMNQAARPQAVATPIKPQFGKRHRIVSAPQRPKSSRFPPETPVAEAFPPGPGATPGRPQNWPTGPGTRPGGPNNCPTGPPRDPDQDKNERKQYKNNTFSNSLADPNPHATRQGKQLAPHLMRRTGRGKSLPAGVLATRPPATPHRGKAPPRHRRALTSQPANLAESLGETSARESPERKRHTSTCNQGAFAPLVCEGLLPVRRPSCPPPVAHVAGPLVCGL